jgi:uncharacterized membrane-anchored protein
MAYEPRGKVATLIGAMRAAPDKPVWSAAEVAACMEIPVANVTAHLQSALSHQTLYRKLDNGKSSYSLQRFDAPAPAVATAIPWTPPKMVAPRATPAPTASPAPRAEPQEQPVMSLPASVPLEAVKREAEPEEEEQEAQEPFDACMWMNGDLDLHGLLELEGGGHRILAKDVHLLRQRLAWMPLQ